MQYREQESVLRYDWFCPTLYTILRKAMASSQTARRHFISIVIPFMSPSRPLHCFSQSLDMQAFMERSRPHVEHADVHSLAIFGILGLRHSLRHVSSRKVPERLGTTWYAGELHLRAADNIRYLASTTPKSTCAWYLAQSLWLRALHSTVSSCFISFPGE